MKAEALPRPQALPVLVDGIPPTMRAERRWVVWSYEWRAGVAGKPGKWTKVPYVATDPARRASSTDPSTWRSFDDALGAYEDGKCDGIGFVLGDGYVGFDVDGNDAPEYVRLLNTYTERSPGGQGIHCIARGAKLGARCRTGAYELYEEGRYFTVTGQHVVGTPLTVEERTAEIAELESRVFVNVPDDALVARVRTSENFVKLWSGDPSAYGSASEADLAFCGILARATTDRTQIERLWRQSGLWRQDKGGRRPDYVNRTIAKALEGRSLQSGRRITLEPASGIGMRRAVYTWDQRLPLGMLSLILGREGSGKSLLALTIAADLTRGRLAGCHRGQPKGVIVVATEDAWEYVVVPRLRAAGADLTRVFRVNVTTMQYGEVELSLPDDLPALTSNVEQDDVALMLLDPLISRLGKKLDTHVDAEVRQALEPLRAFAEALRLSVLGIIHPNKSQIGIPTDPLNAIMGSRAFSAVSRSTLFLQADPEGTPLYLMHIKNNIGPFAPTLELSISDAVAGFDEDQEEVHAPRIDWGSQHDPDERWQTLLHELRKKEQAAEKPDSARDTAIEFLVRYLDKGPADSTVVIEAGKDAGINKRTMQRAADDMQLAKTWTRDHPPKLFWGLPKPEAQPDAPEI